MSALSNGPSLFYLLYRSLGWPILRLGFAFAGLFNRKIRTGLEMRAGSPWAQSAQLSSTVVWFHCASGEFEYAKPVITELKLARPDVGIVVTYFSPTFAKAVAGFPGVDFATPLPWDTPQALNAFITAQEPTVLLVARTDTWPELLRTAKARGLRTLLFAATLSETSGRVRNPLARWMSRSIFSNLDEVFCVDAADARAFDKLGLEGRTSVAGDTRYDQVMNRLRAPKPLKEKLFTTARPTLICGSTWKEDEAVLIATAREVREVDFVIVPHEPTEEHLLSLEIQLREAGLKSVRYSKATHWDTGSILLVDKIGILAELYQKGDFAFVGGSFRKTVHSVMEPLASGCVTFVGPLHHNNREAMEFREISAVPGLTQVQEVANAETFAAKLRMANVSFTPALAQKIRREVEARAGKSSLVVDWILRNVPTKH